MGDRHQFMLVSESSTKLEFRIIPNWNRNRNIRKCLITTTTNCDWPQLNKPILPLELMMKPWFAGNSKKKKDSGMKKSDRKESNWKKKSNNLDNSNNNSSKSNNFNNNNTIPLKFKNICNNINLI